jgi:hypothetical protein
MKAIKPHPTAAPDLPDVSDALANITQTKQTRAAPTPKSHHTHHSKLLGLKGIDFSPSTLPLNSLQQVTRPHFSERKFRP